MIKMIVFMPHIFGESIYDSIDQIKEFETISAMKEYLCSLYNKHLNININNIVIDDQKSHNDERLGWKDKKYVCLKKDGTSICIGYCATKYKNLNETINKPRIEKEESDSITTLIFIVKNMNAENYFHLGKYAEQRVCLFKENELWKVYETERGEIIDEKCHTKCLNACIDVIYRLSDTKEMFENNKKKYLKIKTLNK